MNLNEEQILALAPDDSSKKSGKELASPSKWSNTGMNADALWGECKGSGKDPYRTQVDLANIAFKCSCPSRKFPCKHGLGVMLLYTRQKALFPEKEAPAWVQDWISKRGEKAEKKKEKAEKPVDVEAQAKRQQQRMKKVEGGIEELQLVLKDIARNGILNMPEKAQALFSNLTKRMVDAQASGLAVMTRELAELNYYREHWHTQFLDQLLRIYLVTAAFKKADALAPELLEEVKSQIGFTQSTEELQQQEGVKDQWFVLGQQKEQQDQLTVQRNWLYGTQSGKYALVLQFYVRTQLPEFTLAPGTTLEAELSFYKSISPFRALLKGMGKTSFPTAVQGFETWAAAAAHEQEHYIRSPFTQEMPFFLNTLRLARQDTQWVLTDKDGSAMRVALNEKQLHKMLAVSGGKPFSAAMVGQEGTYAPLGMMMDGNYTVLQ